MIYLFKKINKKGFTLIEVLVSVALLSTIILGINRIYFGILQNQKSMIRESYVYSDMEYFLRIASNTIRSAQKSDGFLCSIPQDNFFLLEDDDHKITFIQDGSCVSFYLSEENGFGGIGFYKESIPSDQIITSSQTNISNLLFAVEDNISSGQPLVTILIKASPVSNLDKYVYSQTSVSIKN